MSATTDQVLVQATIPFGRAAGASTAKILRNTAGTTFYCAGTDTEDCDYTADNYGAVFAHRGHHTARQARINGVTVESLRMRAQSLLEDIDKISAANPLAAENARLKQRAMTAERKLAALKRALS